VCSQMREPPVRPITNNFTTTLLGYKAISLN
jgi:hypothetical protein